MVTCEDGHYHRQQVDLVDCVLMQYTGLKDKNGKEIYEGDLNANYEKRRSEIVFYAGGFYLKYDRLQYVHIGATTEFDRNVIGNIYENPDRLTATTSAPPAQQQ